MSILVQCLISCMFIGLAHGIIGTGVNDAKAHGYPFVVSVSTKSSYNTTGVPNHLIAVLHLCTGTLISHKNVLTVAHCLLPRQPDQVEIIAGSTNLKKGHRFDIESWITYSEWKYKQKNAQSLDDIAVITLKGEIRVPLIPPAEVITVNYEYLHDQEVRLVGWGEMINGKQPVALKTGLLKVISNEECSTQGTMLKGKPFNVPSNYFCTHSKPWVISTRGDGGGPLLNKKLRVVGINIGTCPRVEGYPEEMFNELIMNCHLHLHYYRDFLKEVIDFS